MAIPKGVKYALLALAPVALAVSLWFSWGDDSPVPNQCLMVDINTGEIVSLKKDRIVSIPAANTKGELALVRIEKDPSGGYVVIERDRELFTTYFAGRTNLKIDTTTFRVTQ